jgi:hypothetical protein
MMIIYRDGIGGMSLVDVLFRGLSFRGWDLHIQFVAGGEGLVMGCQIGALIRQRGYLLGGLVDDGFKDFFSRNKNSSGEYY